MYFVLKSVLVDINATLPIILLFLYFIFPLPFIFSLCFYIKIHFVDHIQLELVFCPVSWSLLCSGVIIPLVFNWYGSVQFCNLHFFVLSFFSSFLSFYYLNIFITVIYLSIYFVAMFILINISVLALENTPCIVNSLQPFRVNIVELHIKCWNLAIL